MKFIVITGGSVSGIGKGTSASSMGVVLRSQGLRVTAIKIDPYLNVDAGTISPHEHGEVFVLRDGHEGDLDLGNYERALEVSLTRDHNVTTGKIYRHIIAAERNGDFLGNTVQVVPHVTDCIQDWLTRVARIPVTSDGLEPDVCLVEIGGTVGDIESSVYLEAVQQLFGKLRPEDYALVHVVFVPEVGEEQKTKPAQHSFRFLREAGLTPHFLLCRSKRALSSGCKAKLALFSQVPKEHVIGLADAPVLYTVPQSMMEQNLGELILKKLDLSPAPLSPTTAQLTPLELWNTMAERILANKDRSQGSVAIAIVAKYMGYNDTYLSVIRALEHSACEANLRLIIQWVDAEHLVPEDSELCDAAALEQWQLLKSADGVLAPGGFGERGIEGKIIAARYCRENHVPYFGICLGLQLCLIEGARNLLGLVDANSEEFDPASVDKIVVYMPETVNQIMGGTMRLGDRPTYINDKDSLVSHLYDQQEVVVERHRHRYEVNIEYVSALEEVGYHFVGKDDKGQRMEIIERRDHPFFVATQYHPEFTSTMRKPNPIFLGFVLASANTLAQRLEANGGKLLSGSGYLKA
eukprot:Blabericola_migrator_1__711@NODE_1177_length_5203_cov_152_764213_g800_i0_p1_GENE_NODE_1177_length_5203_cov_152_764213_g800_i0NODE_1177_length_5203_cov_152_764213_g800_i0_p1_ORF_typecomplete_len579_score85_38CTP_synth_N/PF06418_14/3_7e114GATase/PF00117_28/1_2e44Peptidase_C26/PF07722_13/7_5e09ArsA_ATPase/PF02374_15/0_16AAA_31/PF13614_6/0_19AAA_31/PF13614_6/8_8e03_NODE_1177_length_5203_cov_152_764213_g800_i025314267